MELKILVLLGQYRSECMALEKHGIDDMRKVEAMLMSEALVILAVGGHVGKRISSGCEVMGYYALLDDIGNIVHVIDRDVTFVLGIDPIELFQRMNDNGIAGCDLPKE